MGIERSLNIRDSIATRSESCVMNNADDWIFHESHVLLTSVNTRSNENIGNQHWEN